MTTEKLKRVQSIRRWLEKAEQSYLRHREVAGELNLLMAQAEMQRLKERDYTCPKRRPWKMRIIAFIVAAGLFSGLTFWQNRETETTQSVPVSVIQEIPPEKWRRHSCIGKYAGRCNGCAGAEDGKCSCLSYKRKGTAFIRN